MGVGAFSDIATFSYFNGINESWVPDITTKFSYIDVEVLEKGDMTIANNSAKYVTFEYTSENQRYIETTYHIWQPTGEYRLYRIRVNCLRVDHKYFANVFEDFVDSFSLLK